MTSEICGRCHKPLSLKESVQRGMGIICWNKVHKSIEAKAQEKDKLEPLSDHFITVVGRFITHGRLQDKDGDYFMKEANSIVEKKDKGLAEMLAYEAVHFAISGKTKLENINSLIRDITNMFDLASNFKESHKQERYLRKVLWKMQREQIRQERAHRQEQTQQNLNMDKIINHFEKTIKDSCKNCGVELRAVGVPFFDNSQFYDNQEYQHVGKTDCQNPELLK